MAARPRHRRRSGAAIWLLAAFGLGLSALSGCASKSEASRAPGAEAGPAYDAGSSIDELERALADEERRLSAAGVRLPTTRADASVAEAGGADEAYAESEDAAPSEPPPVAPEAAPMANQPERRDEARGAGQRCSDVCSLSTSICDLEGHICGLAQRHPGEDRYAQVCQRASGDCRAAQEACDGCR